MDSARTASRTAVLVCQGRAAANGRLAVGRFADETAMSLLQDGERLVVDGVRSGSPPSDWRERLDYELVQATAEGMAPRTVAIDDAIEEAIEEAIEAASAAQVVVLGAGLDGRAWRMTSLAEVDVYEVDHPASQDAKRDRVAAAGLTLASKSVTYAPVDFSRDRLDDRLAAAGHQRGEPTIWVWEGVVPYLSGGEVAATVSALAGASAAGSRLIVQYQAPSLVASTGRLAIRGMNRLARREDMWTNEPSRSTWKPASIAGLLARNGYQVVRDDNLLTIADELGVTATHRRSLSAGRVLVSDLDA
ncbi:MAG TPA: class I SAM-dependent methyltransferase [Nocardioidaceae bacterium]|nr:class I SAM-dependent methyltransferase [Nocardioidaceae bacterium]